MTTSVSLRAAQCLIGWLGRRDRAALHRHHMYINHLSLIHRTHEVMAPSIPRMASCFVGTLTKTTACVSTPCCDV